MSALGRLLWPQKSSGAGLLFLALSMLMGVLGGALAVLIRTQLSALEGQGFLLPETYLSVVTLHGSVMVFGVAMSALFAGIGCLVLPRLLKRERLAWHPLLPLSFWLLALSQLILLGSLALESGAAGSGWTALPPLSGLEPMAWDGQDLWMLGMGLVCLAYLLISLVYSRNRCCLSGTKPLFVQAYRLAAGAGLCAFPCMLIALCLLAADRHLGSSYFMPDGVVINDEVLAHAGGLPFLFRTLFWHLGHPSLLILTLPALGIACEVTARSTQAPLFGERSSLLAMQLMLLASLVLFGQRLSQAGSLAYFQESTSPLAFVGVACLIIIGTNLALSLRQPGLRLGLPMHFVVGMLVAILCASLGGLWLAAEVSSERLHGSYFAVGHLHLLLGLLSILAIFAALHQWFGAIFGRRMDEGLGRLHFWLSFISLLGIFVLMQFQGFSGLLRGYWEHSHYNFAQLGQDLAPIITGLTYLAAGAQALFFFNLFSSIWLGEAIKHNQDS